MRTYAKLLTASAAIAMGCYAILGGVAVHAHGNNYGNHEGQNSACKETARKVWISCRTEAQADLWLAFAAASNLPTWQERKEAQGDAREEFDDAIEECREQFGARCDLCEKLDESIYDPDVDPENFSDPQENPYFPLVVGTTYMYEKETDEGTETVVVEVTDETREILGIECIVVRDIESLDGEVVEDTRDYFAADNWGNVWYLGENSTEIEEGLVVSTAGSWIAGEDGAKPGIIMLAMPEVGDTYRQEWFLGEAEDAAMVLSLDEEVSVPFDDFQDCLQTADFTPIEPGNLEWKFYALGIGLVLEMDPESGEALELIDITN